MCSHFVLSETESAQGGIVLMSAHPNAAEQLAMTVFPLSLKALAILAIAALAGEQEGDKAKPPLPPPAPHDADEDFEDGDIATPKCDCYGNDDEPL